MIKVVLCIEHPLERLGARALVEKAKGMKVMHESSDAKALIRHVKSKEFSGDVIAISDIYAKDGQFIAAIKRSRPAIKVVCLSDGRLFLRDVLSRGVDWIVESRGDPELIRQAILDAHQGKIYFSQQIATRDFETIQARDGLNLSKRELEVLELVAGGLSSDAIGKKLGITKRTVEFHRSQLLNKFNADNSIVMLNTARHYRLIADRHG